jgi:hypothetical protein
LTDADLDRTRQAMRDAGLAIRDGKAREAVLHLRLAATLVELWAAEDSYGPVQTRAAR